MVKSKPCVRKRSVLFPILATKIRNLKLDYSFIDSNGISQLVCRDFFLKCLQVTSSRVHYALKNANKNPSAKDNRGHFPSMNKTKEADENIVKEFIGSIPCYESHYCREKTNKKYLQPDLNIIKLYREYKTLMEFRHLPSVSENIFRKIFNTEFNLSFKRRHTDTCKSCDEFKSKLGSFLILPEMRMELESKKKQHFDLIEETNRYFREDVQHAQDSEGKVSVLTFDLQKTLETPSISTSVAFYKRQLWTYNLCIYDEIERKG